MVIRNGLCVIFQIIILRMALGVRDRIFPWLTWRLSLRLGRPKAGSPLSTFKSPDSVGLNVNVNGEYPSCLACDKNS
jgi:hypothetical protein